jgi:hypothetical protein
LANTTQEARSNPTSATSSPSTLLLPEVLGSRMRMGLQQFVKTSHESLAIEVCDNTLKDGVTASPNATNPNEVGTFSATRPSKRAKKDENAHDDLVQVIDRGNKILSALADAMREVAIAKTVKATLPMICLRR